MMVLTYEALIYNWINNKNYGYNKSIRILGKVKKYLTYTL